MRKVLGLLVSICGALIGGAGYFAYDTFSHVIHRGETLWGLGWLFENISEGEAHLAVVGGVVAMVIGLVIVILGLGIALERR